MKTVTKQDAPPGLGMRPERVHVRRLAFIVVAIVAGFGCLIVRLVHLQIVRHPEMAATTQWSTTSYDTLRACRGDIVGRDGTIYAREEVAYAVAIDPTGVSPENLQPAIDLLSRGLGLADEERRAIAAGIQERMDRAERGEGKRPRFVLFRREVAAGMVGELRAAAARVLPPSERSAIIFQPVHSRRYPLGPMAGVVFGGVSPGIQGTNLEGVAGLELFYEESINARDGKLKVRRDGRRFPDRWFSRGDVDVHPVHGYNAITTIDSRIQGIAEEELERGLERERAAAGTVIVMDARNGDILAMVNLPSLDPNHFHEYPPQEFEERRRNRAIESQFEPGSTIKPFIAAVALEKKLFGLDDVLWSGGRVAKIMGRLVQDVSDHGAVTFAKAVIFSSNIGMTHVGLRLGRDGLIETLDRFHFQRKTGIPLPGEAIGKRTPRNRWSEKYTSISVSFGYEVMITPIQLCAAFASVVNGGHLFVPRLVERLERKGETIEIPVREAGRPISEQTSRTMRDILVQVVEEGTGRALRIPGFPFGGKTGTRISAGRNGNQVRDCLSSFVAFAPANEPEMVILAMVERPKEHHYGSTVAGPVVTGILKRVFRIAPDIAADARRR